MMTNIRKRIGAFGLACAVIMATPLAALAANVDGGVWDYGTRVSGINQKTVYSNYFHPSRVHRSSVTIGTTYVDSNWVPSGQTSYASATGSWTAETHAYYDCR